MTRAWNIMPSTTSRRVENDDIPRGRNPSIWRPSSSDLCEYISRRDFAGHLQNCVCRGLRRSTDGQLPYVHSALEVRRRKIGQADSRIDREGQGTPWRKRSSIGSVTWQRTL